jgi:ribosomal protein S18 acetylase RimI-like enzyme
VSRPERVYDHPETKEYATLVKAFRNDSHLCFGLKQNQEIMAFMWCNLDRCHWYASPFALKEDEAYLFDAYTYKKYRGMNLAPYLMYQVYKSLNKIGRTKLFSITEYLNTPAMKFKKKLGCRHLKLALFIKPFRLFKWNITLKDF